ncbi:hypothetical protein [Spiroplasma taiwanense]|uniref:Lipoprotein n=1 Tax=Spiroplasma taiwanense CT-1 TaxID=1276220 RepID=S5LXV5_9MOLU|nr:hypothetical protein [Spiroplasma taiwanense]AGR41431.1 hypothetical protein STAIW_v1c08450 [Spiroplasma taiwanense CT-1]
MKKLLSAVSAITLVSSSTITVVACSSNEYFEKFEGWIANKESFVLYIGADDCDYCVQFENAMDNQKTYVEQKLTKMSTDYQNLYTENVYQDSLTAFGEKLTNNKPVDFRTFKTEEKANNFKEKWSINLLDWIKDKVIEIYFDNLIASSINNSDLYKFKKIAKEKVNTYFDSNKGTPFFLTIRNGKLVSWTQGFEKDSLGWDENSLNKLFDPIVSEFLNSEIETEIVNKINGSSTGGEGSTDSAAMKVNNYNYTNNLDEYSKNYDLQLLLDQYKQTL